MSVGIDIFALGNPEAEKVLRAVIEKLFKGKEGNWHVSFVGQQKSTIWQAKVDGPNGFRWMRNFEGIGKHSPEFIAAEMGKALPK